MAKLRGDFGLIQRIYGENNSMIRRTSLILALAAGSTSLAAQQPAATALTAAPSTRATTVVNLVPPEGAQGEPAQIRIDYGQPHLRGRKLHTGNLVPLDSIWRLGANAATELETGVDLLIGGQPVPKGKYTLFALPTAAGWKLIINKNPGNEYSAAQDLVRIDLRRRMLASPTESLSISMIPATGPGKPAGELRISWGDAELSTTWSMR
jgi:hypothetical protein